MNRLRGFSLIELTLVIAILGILAATVAIFLRPALDAYFDTRRRAETFDEADTALRRVGRDVRLAVPNSIRTPNASCFEFVPSKAGGLYRRAADGVNADSDPLDTTAPDVSFDVLSPLANFPQAGDFVVIGNQDAADVYGNGSGGTRVTRGTVSAWGSPPAPGGAAVGQGRITLTAATQFPAAYDGGRFFLVDGATQSVFYDCRDAGVANGRGTGQLVRIVRNFTAAAPAACPGALAGVVVVSRVAACNFVYNPAIGGSPGSGLLWTQIELMDAGERVSLNFGVHVSNVP